MNSPEEKIKQQIKRLGAWSHEVFISRIWVNSFLVNFQKHGVLLGVYTLLILNRAPIHDQNNCTGQWSFCCILISRQECCYLIINTTEVLCFCRDCKLWSTLLLICFVLLFRDLNHTLTSLQWLLYLQFPADIHLVGNAEDICSWCCIIFVFLKHTVLLIFVKQVLIVWGHKSLELNICFTTSNQTFFAIFRDNT